GGPRTLAAHRSEEQPMPRRLHRRTRLLALLLACCMPFALAQDATDDRPIEQRMTQSELEAAGLHKLSPDELAQLNAWLRGTIRIETEAAAAAAAKKVEDDNRGFFHFGSEEPIAARLAGRFEGFGRGRTYLLDNGQQWKQVDTQRLDGVKLDSPKVTIKPGVFGN